MAGGIRLGNKDIRFAGDTAEDNDNKLSCPYCGGVLVGPDSSYKNCQGCGRSGIPTYQGKQESELESFIEPSDTPWGNDGYAVSLDDPKLDSDRRPILKERSIDWRPGDDEE